MKHGGQAPRTKLAVVTAALCLGLGFSSVAQAKTLALQFLGPSDVTTAFNSTLDALGFNPNRFSCFATSLRDPRTQREGGAGVDCLRFDQGMPPGDDLEATVVTFFILKAGTISNLGKTSVRRFVPGVRAGGPPPRTHMTGSIASGDTIIAGTRAFDGVAGQVRVSGVMALKDTDNGFPFFDRRWILELREDQGDEDT